MIAKRALVTQIEALLRFVKAWERCESTRGRYSCSPTHDVRCTKGRGIDDKCVCGSDELEAAYEALPRAGR